MIRKTTIFITAVSLVCAFVLCVAACKIQYSVYKANNLETAKSVLLEYGIIDDNFLAAEDITKELFVVGFMRTLGADDGYAKSYDERDMESVSSREFEDAEEMKFYRFGYLRGSLINVREKDDGIYPQMKMKSSDAVSFMYSILPTNREFSETLCKMRDMLAFFGSGYLERDDFFIMMYNKLNEKRFIYFDREKEFNTSYNNYQYTYPDKSRGWRWCDDEYRSCTYLEMLKERRELDRLYEGTYGEQE